MVLANRPITVRAVAKDLHILTGSCLSIFINENASIIIEHMNIANDMIYKCFKEYLFNFLFKGFAFNLKCVHVPPMFFLIIINE